MVVHVYHPYRQPDGENYCQTLNGHCSHFCLPVPKVVSSLRMRCSCPDDLILSSDSLTCITKGTF